MSKTKNVNLLEGPVLLSLTKLAIPIMATFLVQVAYNLIDMLWIGRIGSNAVAAVGAAGMYMWLSNGLAFLTKTGAQVKVGHSIGSGRIDEAAAYTTSALQLCLLCSVIYGFICFFFAGPLIHFFNLTSPQVIKDAELYLMITCGLTIFSLLNQTLTGILTATGDSRSPFIATTIGLVTNIFLDPLMIWGFGPFPAMGVAGAGAATVIAQAIVFGILYLNIRKDTMLFPHVNLFYIPGKAYFAGVCRIGFPAAAQSMIFTSISMIISRMVADYGDAAIAVQKVGAQIESISWMTADGFAASVNSFIAQNYGAKNIKRIKKGYTLSMLVVITWGLLCNFLLMVYPEQIFRLFITEAPVIPMGVDYLWILGISQVFVCLEVTTAGAFNGLDHPLPPALTGIVLTAARIPAAMALTTSVLGLNGIWWAITISSVLKGIVLVLWFTVYSKRHLRIPSK